jgi:hypothetical protein
MRTARRLLIIAMVAVLLCTQASPAWVSFSIGFNTFQSGLAPYGAWVSVGSVGQVWCPNQVGLGWRPYSAGHWVLSDEGWVWVSDEPWGWATYHYGRWICDANYGWCWVPGAVWAPSWVTWYVGPHYIGWAPMGPAGWAEPPIERCCFVPCHSFLSVNVGSYCVPPAQNVTIVHNTTFVNNINVVNNKTVVNPGPSSSFVARATGRQPQLVSFRESRTPGMHQTGSSLAVYRPVVNPASAPANTPLLRNEAAHGRPALSGWAPAAGQARVAPTNHAGMAPVNANHANAWRPSQPGVQSMHAPAPTPAHAWRPSGSQQQRLPAETWHPASTQQQRPPAQTWHPSATPQQRPPGQAWHPSAPQQQRLPAQTWHPSAPQPQRPPAEAWHGSYPQHQRPPAQTWHPSAPQPRRPPAQTWHPSSPQPQRPPAQTYHPTYYHAAPTSQHAPPPPHETPHH